VNNGIKNLITEDAAVYLAEGIPKNLSNINLIPTTADETYSMELSPF
jgi:hypothetical protein